MRWISVLLPGLLSIGVTAAGCNPKARPVKEVEANNGIDIVPPAILAASRSTPTTLPTRMQELPDLIATLQSSRTQNHRHVIDVLLAAGMLIDLETKRDYTIFAPTDDAFDKLPPGTLDRLLLPANHAKLVQFAQYHIVTGRLSNADLLQTDGSVTTMSKLKVVVRGIDDKITINDANVVETVTTASNGNILWVDNVLDPEFAP